MSDGVTSQETPERQLADALDRLLPVVSATPLSADLSPRNRAEVEAVLAAEWDTLPRTVVDSIYAQGFALVSAGHRTPEHRYVLAVER